MRTRWTVGARADLLEMFEYIARENLPAARRLHSRIRAATRRLDDLPNIGRVVPEFDNSSLRELVVRPCRIVYVVRAEEVHVLGIIHSRRQMPDLHERD